MPELPGTGIIYTLTKRDADQVAGWLNKNGIASKAYYSGVVGDDVEDTNIYREYLEEQLYNNELKALVATTALGMGYDKPDLGFVVHYQAPGSIVAYYQQVGRAGRAINHAVGILMTGREDDDIHEFFRTGAFPREHWVLNILEALEESDGLSTTDLESSVNLRRGQIEKVLKYLSVDSPAPIIKDGSLWKRTPVPYQMDLEKIRRLIAQRETEWEEVRSYIETPGCLMEFLGRALDDEDPQRCGKCAQCLGRPIVSDKLEHEHVVEAGLYLRHAEMPLQCKKQVARDAFLEYGFRGNLPPDLQAETGRMLSRWGDAGWGKFVADDKHSGYFRDELVGAVAEMIRDRWQPEPAPTWVACIPSVNHPTLVPGFAERLSRELGLPFVPAITKIRENEQQKVQQNRYHQCRNLDGVFGIRPNLPDGPVLLIDDVVDSGWTLTIAAALLRRAGSGLVWPVALATSSVGS